jgi:hypothetical protein
MGRASRRMDRGRAHRIHVPALRETRADEFLNSRTFKERSRASVRATSLPRASTAPGQSLCGVPAPDAPTGMRVKEAEERRTPGVPVAIWRSSAGLPLGRTAVGRGCHADSAVQSPLASRPKSTWRRAARVSRAAMSATIRDTDRSLQHRADEFSERGITLWVPETRPPLLTWALPSRPRARS